MEIDDARQTFLRVREWLEAERREAEELQTRAQLARQESNTSNQFSRKLIERSREAVNRSWALLRSGAELNGSGA